jgi:lysozyme
MLLAGEIPAPVRRVLPLLVRFEGMSLTVYLCPGGVPTIGLGSTRYADGRRVALGDPPITAEHAWLLAVHQLRTEYLPAVLRLCPGADSFDRLAALLDFAYNLGIGALMSSTLRRRVNARDWAGAQREIQRWIKASGRTLRGLIIRRAVEAALLA